jgi:hypothetical protein
MLKSSIVILMSEYVGNELEILLHRILREGNVCPDILAKLRANSSKSFVQLYEPCVALFSCKYLNTFIYF